jgi:hypothetical protein
VKGIAGLLVVCMNYNRIVRIVRILTKYHIKIKLERQLRPIAISDRAGCGVNSSKSPGKSLLASIFVGYLADRMLYGVQYFYSYSTISTG